MAVSLRVLKLPAGPMILPKPGPMFPKAAPAPEIEVTKSSPVMLSATATSPNVSVKNMKKDMTEIMTSPLIGRPS